jgi:peptidoglycan/LPS O-acetylase OafA/YrhL
VSRRSRTSNLGSSNSRADQPQHSGKHRTTTESHNYHASSPDRMRTDPRREINETSPAGSNFDPIRPSRSVANPLTHPKYRADIDGLRAIAVILVIGFHAFPHQFGGGFVGVDLFFVISGFLISLIIFSNLENNTFSFVEFQARRIKRIFPSLLVVLVAFLALGWFLLLANEYQELGKHIVAAATFVSNFVFWSETGYFDKAANTKPLLQLWSLGVEEQFYIFWPLLLRFSWERKLNFIAITIGVGALSFVANIIFAVSAPIAAFYSPFTRFWELMVGGGLAYVSLHKPHHLITAPNLKSAVGVTLIFLSVYLLNNQPAIPTWWALLPTFGAWFVISAGPTAWLNCNVLNSRFLVLIGLISYPLYLWHWPLLSLAWIIDGSEPSRSTRIGLLFLSVVLAALTYLLVERPIRSQKYGNGAVKWLCAAMIAVGLAGALIYFVDGAKFRLVNGNPAGFNFDTGESDKTYSQCFLNEHVSLPFENSCQGKSSDNPHKPLVLIWGDSHAHSFALGLTHQADLSGFDLAQYTASACPPLIDFAVQARPQCRNINEYIAHKISELKPNAVILAAFWYLYNGYEGYTELDYAKLRATIVFLKEQHIRNITILGELPTFLTDQPRVGIRNFSSGKTDRTYNDFNHKAAAINEKIKAFAAENDINFVSPIDLLCNAEGCLISTSKAHLVPLASDYGHLTKSGAIYLLDLAIERKQLLLPTQP